LLFGTTERKKYVKKCGKIILRFLSFS